MSSAFPADCSKKVNCRRMYLLPNYCLKPLQIISKYPNPQRLKMPKTGFIQNEKIFTYMDPATAGSRIPVDTCFFILLKTIVNVFLETRPIIFKKVSEMMPSAAVSSSLRSSSSLSLSCLV